MSSPVGCRDADAVRNFRDIAGEYDKSGLTLGEPMLLIAIMNRSMPARLPHFS